MELWEQISQQRVKHIISSYHLSGSETELFDVHLNDLLNHYPAPLIELAVVECLVDQWLTVPMPRGLVFLNRVRDRLAAWEKEAIISTITPEQFQQITGLDPSPIFGNTGRPPSRPIVHPS